MLCSSQPFLSTIANVHTCYGLRRDKDRFLMALLTAYFDESGIHNDGQICAVAGFVGNDAQWAGFAAEWIPAIKPRKNLHMVKLKWDRYRHRIEPLLAKLGPIPHKYNLHPVAVTLDWEDYNKIVKGKTEEKYRNPYILCALAAVGVVLSEIAGADDVYFLFDRQEGLRKETMHEVRDNVYEKFGVDSRISGLEFIPRRTTVCLDPADYLAYAVRERRIDEKSDKSRLCQSIVGNKGHGGRIIAQHLQWMIDESNHPDCLERMIAQLVSNPYFRGPENI